MKSLKNSKIALIALFSALLIALSCLMPAFGGFAAYAYDSSGPRPDPIINEYENIYYLSDTAESKYYYENYLTDFAEDYASIYEDFGYAYYYNINDSFTYHNNAFEFFVWCELLTYNVRNSLVFLECNSEFVREFCDAATIEDYRFELEVAFSALEEYFRELKDNGCRIILLLNYDEHKFYGEDYDYRGFLDYVDVYVDFDMLYVLFATLVGEFEEDSSEPYTLFLDFEFSSIWFLRNYVIPHYNVAYEVYLQSMDLFEKEKYNEIDYKDRERFYADSSYFFEDLVERDIVQVIVMYDDGRFMDLASGRIFSVDYIRLEEIIQFNKVAAFGSYGNVMFNSWIYAMSYLGGRSGFTLTAYVYDCPSSELLRYEAEILDLVSCPSGRWYLDNYTDEDYLDDVLIVQLMYDSIFVRDLSYYSNRDSRCSIRHKTIYGSGGRLRDDAVQGLGLGDMIYVG